MSCHCFGHPYDIQSPGASVTLTTGGGFVTEFGSNGCNYHVLQQRAFLCLRFYRKRKSAPIIRRSYSSAFQKRASGSNSSVTITFSIDQLAYFISYAMLLVSSSSSSSQLLCRAAFNAAYCAGRRLTLHIRTPEVRPES